MALVYMSGPGHSPGIRQTNALPPLPMLTGERTMPQNQAPRVGVLPFNQQLAQLLKDKINNINQRRAEVGLPPKSQFSVPNLTNDDFVHGNNWSVSGIWNRIKDRWNIDDTRNTLYDMAELFIYLFARPDALSPDGFQKRKDVEKYLSDLAGALDLKIEPPLYSWDYSPDPSRHHGIILFIWYSLIDKYGNDFMHALMPKVYFAYKNFIDYKNSYSQYWKLDVSYDDWVSLYAGFTTTFADGKSVSVGGLDLKYIFYYDHFKRPYSGWEVPDLTNIDGFISAWEKYKAAYPQASEALTEDSDFVSWMVGGGDFKAWMDEQIKPGIMNYFGLRDEDQVKYFNILHPSGLDIKYLNIMAYAGKNKYTKVFKDFSTNPQGFVSSYSTFKSKYPYFLGASQFCDWYTTGDPNPALQKTNNQTANGGGGTAAHVGAVNTQSALPGTALITLGVGLAGTAGWTGAGLIVGGILAAVGVVIDILSITTPKPPAQTVPSPTDWTGKNPTGSGGGGIIDDILSLFGLGGGAQKAGAGPIVAISLTVLGIAYFSGGLKITPPKPVHHKPAHRKISGNKRKRLKQK